MKKPQLTVNRLLECGFEEVGCWELNDARDLSHSIDLPKKAGVYAFAINGLVQYVGLASKSLKQRLGFYRRPGASQRTNVRLNEIIRGHIDKSTVVQILIAHPPDHEWKGFRISGPEGLEAGLIAEFALPWNMRGSVTQDVVGEKSDTARPRHTGRAARILQLIQQKPGLTGGEIATAIYGPRGTQPQVNSLLHQLIDAGLIERRGVGQADPYRYFSK